MKKEIEMSIFEQGITQGIEKFDSEISKELGKAIEKAQGEKITISEVFKLVEKAKKNALGEVV
jgi:hypothetical protein